MVLELALGRKPEVCPAHHQVLQCPVGGCGKESRGVPSNDKMLMYAANRIMGTPAQAHDKTVSMEFVQSVAKHVADVFNSINDIEDAQERRNQFAEGMVQMWALIGDQQR